MVNGYVAVRERDDIGRLFWLRPVDAARWELFLAVDCAGYSDGGYQWMLDGGIIAEIDYDSAIRWGVVGRGVRVEMRRMLDEHRGYRAE